MPTRALRASLLACALLLGAVTTGRAEFTPLSPAAEAQFEEGVLRLYSLDYARAQAAFRRIIELEPDNPSGYFFEAGALWWQSSQEYGLFQSTPALQGLFEQDVEASLRKADDYIDSKDPGKKAAGHFVSGMALGTRGQWNLMKRRYIAAYFDGKKSIKHLKKCLKIDEGFYDAYLGLGVFDYQAARFSGAIAKLGILFGMKGNEKRGLERIQLSVDKARYCSRQAAGFLASIYISDMHDFSRALPVVQRLRRDFPSSPFYLFLELILRHRLGDWDGSLDLGRELYRTAAADPVAFRPKWLTLFCGLSGSACLDEEDSRRALEWIDHALDKTRKEKPDGFRTLLRLFRGHCLELLGQREDALKEYRLVATLPPFDDVRDRAKACLEEPCGRESLLGSLKEMSRTR